MESSAHAPVAPVRPVAPYVGGKRNLARRLVELIEATPHQVYAEPFVGMGGVFLRRRLKPRVEHINDLSGDVTTLFRILQRHYPQFMDTLRFQLSSRAEFDRLMRVDPETLTDLERAGRFLYLQRLAFGGKVVGRSFAMEPARPSSFDLNKLSAQLQDLHERLAGVTIERLPFDAFIRRYDTAQTLVYADPPYWGSEDYYGRALFAPADFERLAEALRSMRGRFILSINDTPEIRALFDWAELEPVELAYGLAASGSTTARELIITGGGKL